MPARSMTWATARCPISRYGVCSRCRSASIIEFSKCVRRHQVTKELGSPLQPFALRNGVAIAVKPPCMSTTVPYWSNMQALTLVLMESMLIASPSQRLHTEAAEQFAVGGILRIGGGQQRITDEDRIRAGKEAQRLHLVGHGGTAGGEPHERGRHHDARQRHDADELDRPDGIGLG